MWINRSSHLVSQRNALLLLSTFFAVPSRASWFNISTKFEYFVGSISCTFSSLYIVRISTSNMSLLVNTIILRQKYCPKTPRFIFFVHLQEKQADGKNLNMSICFVYTWIFWWMSCLITAIVGPILSAYGDNR